MISVKSIQPRLVVTVRSFLLYSVISVVSVPLALSEQITLGNILTTFNIGVGVTLIMGLFLFLINFLTRGLIAYLTPHKMVLYWVLLILLAGALRGILVFYSIDESGFEQPSELTSRITSSAASTLFWLSLISIAVQDLINFRDRYESLLRSSILRAAQSTKGEKASAINNLLGSELKEIEEMLEKVFKNSVSTVMNNDSLIFAAQHVRKIIEENIRPLSHRLWLRSAASFPRVHLRKAVAATLRNLSVPPLLTALFVALPSSFNFVEMYGWIRSAYGSCLIVAVIFFFFLAVKKMQGSWLQQSIPINVTLLLVPGILLSSLLYLSNQYIFSDNTGIATFIYIPLCFFISLVMSTLELAKSDRDRLVLLLEKDLAKEPLRDDATESISAGNLAGYLHNSLQSQLLALSYQFEESAKNADLESSRAALERLGSRINRSIRDDFQNFVETPLDRLNQLQKAWISIANVSISIPESLLADEHRNQLIVQIIEEAIANAVRFSKATEVTIQAQPREGERVLITVSNNGRPEPAGTAGLGSDWLNRYAAGNWERRYSNSGSTLEILI